MNSPANPSRPAVKPAAKGYLPAIDVLRFIAATLVMFCHYGFRAWKVNGESTVQYPELIGLHVLQYVHLLVPLFLIISGFVIPLSAEGKSAGEFARSRVLRLYPVFWLCCTITWVVTSLWGPEALQSGVSTYASNMTMLHGFLHLPDLDAVYWTLTVEMRFYGLVFAVLLLRRYHQMGWFMTGWLVISLLEQVHLLPKGDSFFATRHAPLFAAGFFFSEWFRGRLTKSGAVVLCAALLMGLERSVTASAADAVATGVPTSPVAVVGILLTFYLIFAAICTHRLRMENCASWAPTAGGITYPLYVLHNFAGLTLIHVLADHMNRWWLLALTVAVSYLVSWLIWRFYEKPAAQMLKRLLPFGQSKRKAEK